MKKPLAKKLTFWAEFLWELINKPIVVALVTLYLGSLVLPSLLTQAQTQYLQKAKVNDEKYAYSNSLLNLSYDNFYTARNYYWNYLNASDFEERKDMLWEKHQDATRQWNVHLVSNLFGIEKYYGKDIHAWFENNVQENLNQYHNELLNIRDGSGVNKDRLNQLDKDLENRLYILAEKLVI